MNILLWYLPYVMFSGACGVVLSESELPRASAGALGIDEAHECLGETQNDHARDAADGHLLR
jgi:hypothetical protein